MKIAISPSIHQQHKTVVDLVSDEHPTVLHNLADLNFTYPEIAIISEADLKSIPEETAGQSLLIVISKPQVRLHQLFNQAHANQAFAVISHHELGMLPKIVADAVAVINQRRAERPVNQSLRITSTTGGVGKTFICYQLALSLTKVTRHRPLIIDLTPQYPTLPAVLNIHPTKSWQSVYHLLETDAEITAASLAQLITTTPFGFDVLAAPAENPIQLTEAALQKLITTSHQLTPYVIVDEPLRTKVNSASNLSNLAKQLFVCKGEPQSLIASVEAYQKITQASQDAVDHTMFVLNCYEQKLHQKLLKNSSEQILKFSQKIEYDPEAVKDSQFRHKLIDDPSLILYDDIRRLTHSILKWWEIKDGSTKPVSTQRD